MKINYLSDVHLEFGVLTHELEGEVLVLAGDITVNRRVSWINEAAKHFKYVVYVLGNHEHWRGYIEGTFRKTRQALAPNVYVLENSSVVLDGVAFHGATLWTDFNNHDPLTMHAVDYNPHTGGLQDFRFVRFNGGAYRWTPESAYKTHLKSREFLRNSIQPGDVVVTHHAPTFKSIDPVHTDKLFDGAYASDLSELILDTEPKFWFHGHIHKSNDYMVGNTRVLCNPRGYEGHSLNPNFDLNASVEI